MDAAKDGVLRHEKIAGGIERHAVRRGKVTGAPFLGRQTVGGRFTGLRVVTKLPALSE